jgi:aspartate carbamoyltransferase catalytic subunit
VINMSVSASSVKKGETLQDTCRTLQAMHPDVIVIRHASSGAPNYVASKIGCSVINAGDGMHAHPTQALLDAFTIRRAKGTLDNLVVTIVGDIAHSRVARSNAHLLKLFGCEVRVVGPRTLLPAAADSLGVRVFDRLADGLAGADVVMVLRIQSERLEGSLLPSLREYARTFGIGPGTIGPAKRDAIVMHPGPMNRGVEIESLIADGERSVVLQQVEAGVAVRMALLYLLAGEATDTLAAGEVH